MFSIEQDKNGKFYVKTLKPKSKNRLDYRYDSEKKELKRFDEEHQKKYQKYYEEYQKKYQKYTKEIINRKNEVFDLINILPKNKQPEKAIFTDKEMVEICKLPLNECCKKLNEYIKNIEKENCFDECASKGINVINEYKPVLEIIMPDIAKLKKAFKKTLIQKKYNINDNEISDNCDKLFRKDEKYLKRIKIFGSHLFSKKATLKGKINALFRKFVNSDGLNDDYETKFNTLFNNLMQHNNARKEIKSDKEANAKLNNAFDNGYKAIY